MLKRRMRTRGDSRDGVSARATWSPLDAKDAPACGWCRRTDSSHRQEEGELSPGSWRSHSQGCRAQLNPFPSCHANANRKDQR
eukprot:759063-Hanusia_phi.AAC.2